jgi:hypothetical protein
MPIAVGYDNVARLDFGNSGGNRCPYVREASGLRQIYSGAAADAVKVVVAQTRDEGAPLQVYLIGSAPRECPYLVVVTDGDEPAVPDGHSLNDGRSRVERHDVRVVEDPIRDGTGSWTTATDKGGYEKEAHQVSHIWHGAQHVSRAAGRQAASSSSPPNPTL